MSTNNNIINQIYQPTGRRINFTNGEKVYNLGCGKQSYPGVIGIDQVNLGSVNINHDLEVHPWPIPDNDADIVLTFHTLEHLKDLLGTFEEIYRICKPGARVIIEIPHFRSSAAFQDPTHIRYFTCRTINYFCSPNHTYIDLPIKFKLIDLSIGWPAPKYRPVRYFLKKWLKNHNKLYDNLLYILFPAKILVIELEAVK